jgi:hypothetical protein
VNVKHLFIKKKRRMLPSHIVHLVNGFFFERIGGGAPPTDYNILKKKESYVQKKEKITSSKVI